MSSRRIVFSQASTLILMIILVPGGDGCLASETYTKWMSGSGLWTNTTNWSAGLPDLYKHVEVHGNSSIRVPNGTYPFANLQLGKDSLDHVRFEVDGGKIILFQDPLDV